MSVCKLLWSKRNKTMLMENNQLRGSRQASVQFRILIGQKVVQHSAVAETNAQSSELHSIRKSSQFFVAIARCAFSQSSLDKQI